jgi:hypothetical protein
MVNSHLSDPTIYLGHRIWWYATALSHFPFERVNTEWGKVSGRQKGKHIKVNCRSVTYSSCRRYRGLPSYSQKHITINPFSYSQKHIAINSRVGGDEELNDWAAIHAHFLFQVHRSLLHYKDWFEYNLSTESEQSAIYSKTQQSNTARGEKEMMQPSNSDKTKWNMSGCVTGCYMLDVFGYLFTAIHIFFT